MTLVIECVGLTEYYNRYIINYNYGSQECKFKYRLILARKYSIAMFF